MRERIRVYRLQTRDTVTLDELSRLSGLRVHRLLEMIELGILEPSGSAREGWRFDHRALYRARVGLRLQQDLGVNLAGVGLALDLLDEIRRLRIHAASGDDDPIA